MATEPAAAREVSLIGAGVATEDACAATEEEPWHMFREAGRILGVALPVALSNFFEYLPVLFLVAAVGHLPDSKQDLAATVLGRNFFNSCWAVAWGFTSALHTLAPQAEGAGRADLHALHCQRAVVIVSALCVPLALLQCFSAGILRALGQDASVSQAAQLFTICLIPRLWAEGYFTILQRIGQAMGHASAVAALSSIGCFGAVFFLWFFMRVLGLGYLGAAWTCTAWNLLNFLALAAFLLSQTGPGRGRSLFKPYRPCRQVFAWSGFREYLQLAIPSTLQACLEWWAIDLGVMLAAGMLPDPDLNLAANGAVAGVTGLFYMVWLGVGGSTAIAVGKHVGAGRVDAAKQTIKVAVVLGWLAAGLVSLALLFGRQWIAAVLTDSSDVQDKTASVLIVLAIHVFADSTNCILGGVLRGMGRQAMGVRFQFAGFYLVGVPVAVLLMFRYSNTTIGLECLWVAVIAAAFTSAVCQSVYLARADWAAVLDEARIRNG